LNNLISKARSALEEQGVNILFFAFGLCKWFDVNEPEKELLAPLVLVPVQIKRLAVNGPYTVKRFEEDVVINPAFLRQLKDMGIKTDSVENVDDEADDDGCILERYFDAFRETTASQKGWEIVESCHAGLFNYHKFVMYKDIENNAELVAQNPFLKALATGKYVFDDIHYRQQDAIECVKSGRDVVIQGPPGTGKSQTIVNIIAESIAGGRKVLFVSEKQAALNVVKKRLEENHLGPFCLELHSKKASKHEVYHQFDDVLSILGIDEDGNGTFDSDTLEALRESLNIEVLKKELDSLLFITKNLMNIERFSIVINTLKAMGLTDFLNKYFEMALSAEQMRAVFKKGLYKKYLKSMYEQNEALYFFKSSEYENKREGFLQRFLNLFRSSNPVCS
jgi:hypothetical protein